MSQTIEKFLQNVDIFGVTPNFKYLNQNKFQSKAGGFITLTLVVIFFLVMTQQIVRIGSTPQFIHDQQVEQLIEYELNSQNFQIMITVLSNNNVPISDMSIYNVSAYLYIEQYSLNSDNTYSYSLTQQQLQLTQCPQVELNQQQNYPYLFITNYKKFMCLSDKNKVIMQAGNNKNQYIKFFIQECTGQGGQQCSTPSDITTALQNSSALIYFTNSQLNLSNSNQPYSQSIKMLLYQLQPNSILNAELMLTKTETVDDHGLFSSEQKTNQTLTYSSDHYISISNQQNNNVFELKIVLDSQKVNVYFRYYCRFQDICAYLGGIIIILYIIGKCAIKPYNHYQFQESLYQELQFIDRNPKTKNQQYSNENMFQYYKQVNNNSEKIDRSNTIKQSSYMKQSQNKKKNFSESDNSLAKRKSQNNSFLKDLKIFLQSIFKCAPQHCMNINSNNPVEQEINSVLDLVTLISLFYQVDVINDQLQDSIQKSKMDIQNDVKLLKTPSIATQNDKGLHDESMLVEKMQTKQNSVFKNKSEICMVQESEERKQKEKTEYFKIPLKEQLNQYKEYRERAKSAQKIPHNQISNKFGLHLQKVVQDQYSTSNNLKNMKQQSQEPIQLFRFRQNSAAQPSLPFEYLKNNFEFKQISPARSRNASILKDSCKIDAPSEASTPIPVYKSMNPKLIQVFNDSFSKQQQQHTIKVDTSSPLLTLYPNKCNSFN